MSTSFENIKYQRKECKDGGYPPSPAKRISSDINQAFRELGALDRGLSIALENDKQPEFVYSLIRYHEWNKTWDAKECVEAALMDWDINPEDK